MTVYLLAGKDILTRYIRDLGFKVMTVAHHDCIERLDHDRVILQVPDLDRPLPVPRDRLHQLYMMQQLKCLRHNKSCYYYLVIIIVYLYNILYKLPTYVIYNTS